MGIGILFPYMGIGILFPYMGISILFAVMRIDDDCGRRFIGKLNPHCYSLNIFTP
jgi:hypothetical protein